MLLLQGTRLISTRQTTVHHVYAFGRLAMAYVFRFTDGDSTTHSSIRSVYSSPWRPLRFPTPIHLRKALRYLVQPRPPTRLLKVIELSYSHISTFLGRSDKLFSALNSNEYSESADLKIICGTKSFAVHKVIICPQSKYFRAACSKSFMVSQNSFPPLSPFLVSHPQIPTRQNIGGSNRHHNLPRKRSRPPRAPPRIPLHLNLHLSRNQRNVLAFPPQHVHHGR